MVDADAFAIDNLIKPPPPLDEAVSTVHLRTESNDIGNGIDIRLTAEFGEDLITIATDDGTSIEVECGVQMALIQLVSVNCELSHVRSGEPIVGEFFTYEESISKSATVSRDNPRSASVALQARLPVSGGFGLEAGTSVRHAVLEADKREDGFVGSRTFAQVHRAGANGLMIGKVDGTDRSLKGTLVSDFLGWRYEPVDRSRPYGVVARVRVKSHWLRLRNASPTSVKTRFAAVLRNLLRSETEAAAYRRRMFELLLAHLVRIGLQEPVEVDAKYATISADCIVARPETVSHVVRSHDGRPLVVPVTGLLAVIAGPVSAIPDVLQKAGLSRSRIPAAPADLGDESAAAVSDVATMADPTEALNTPLDPRFTFSSFVVGKPNELAFAASRRVAESDMVPFNPLFLYGGVGLGKTHLMHAIAWNLREKHPQRRVLYMSAEKFMYQFSRALRLKDTVAFKEQFRSVDVLMVDNVQFINAKDANQEEFFHTFNTLVDQNRQVIISADKSPNDLDGLEERLRSRLGWGLVVDIHPTTYELRLGILHSKAEKLETAIPPKVLEFLAHKISSNVRELEGALNRIVAHSTLVGGAITLETTQEVLHDLLKANDQRITIEEIQRKVASHFNIRIADMHSAQRSREIARPRQIAMYLAKQLTQRSLPEIGRKFGARDSTTVMYAVKKVDELRAADRHFDEDVDMLRRMLVR